MRRWRRRRRDEVVPITSKEHPEIDGFYRITDIGIERVPSWDGGLGPRLVEEFRFKARGQDDD